MLFVAVYLELSYFKKLFLGSSQKCSYSGKKALNSWSFLDFRWCHCSKLLFLFPLQQDYSRNFPFANLVGALRGAVASRLYCYRVSVTSVLQAQGHLLRLCVYQQSTCTQMTGRGVVWHALETHTWFPKSGLGEKKKQAGKWARVKLAVCKSWLWLSITNLLLSSISIPFC